MSEKIKVLMVMPEDQASALLATPRARSLDLRTARTCCEARGVLAYGEPVDVVVADLTLEDGNWWSVYQDLSNQDVCAEMVVVAPRRGLDVSEILAHGVYTVLGRPLESEEMVRTIEEAAAHKVNGKGSRAHGMAVAGV
jgi:DNA-binding NtrC family response regulator